MKRILFAVCAVILFAFNNNCSTMFPVKGDKNIITKEIAISDYDKISLPVSGEIHYRQSDANPFLELTTDGNMFEYLDIFVKDRTLYIRPYKHNYNIRPTKLIVNTNSRDIKNINLAGSCMLVLASNINTDELEIRLSGSGKVVSDEKLTVANTLGVTLSGSGNISLNETEAKTLDIVLSGSGKISSKGNVEYCSAKISGSGKIICPNLSAKHLDCKISGSGDVEMDVTESIICRISGSGSLTYTGNPTKVDHKISGSGRILKK
ncbi:MAG: DUF2807 domain-containing protein [Bacteroidales bacterium]|jgi:hypothetical protein|nr:DUF2807 domain-containing protein [Bacteroidales bacterium]